jgi:hypothetical protein
LAAGLFFEFSDEGGVRPQAFDCQVDPRRGLFNFTAGRQHPGAGRTGFAAHPRRIEQENTEAGLRQPPSDGSSDDASANDDRIERHPTILCRDARST